MLVFGFFFPTAFTVRLRMCATLGIFYCFKRWIFFTFHFSLFDVGILLVLLIIEVYEQSVLMEV